ncbi:hypothetical protein Tco_1518491 [Tanacetum coccineum]
MAHVNFKNINKLAKHRLVNGLPSKLFTNDHNCVACNKGKQHKASYKAITDVSTIYEPLQLLHMDLFGPTSIRSIDLQVLFESHKGGHGSLVWSDQQQWHIRSWRLFPFSNVHVLETISGKVVYMFADGSYPISVQLMKKMLKHKLEIKINGVGNDMTYAEQLIQFIKNQIAASIPSA